MIISHSIEAFNYNQCVTSSEKCRSTIEKLPNSLASLQQSIDAIEKKSLAGVTREKFLQQIKEEGMHSLLHTKNEVLRRYPSLLERSSPTQRNALRRCGIKVPDRGGKLNAINIDEQKKYVAHILVQAIKARQSWNELPALQEKRNELKEKLRRLGVKLRRRHGVRYLSDKYKKQLRKQQTFLRQQLFSIEQKIAQIRKKVLADPLWNSATNFWEFETTERFSDFKPSAFLEDTLKAVSKIKGEKYSGEDFIHMVEQGDEAQAWERAFFLLDSSPQLFNKLNANIKQEMVVQLEAIDRSLLELCNSDGSSLISYSALVDQTINKIVQQYPGSNYQQVERVVKPWVCDLSFQQDNSKTKLILGGALLAGALLAPFTAGSSLAWGVMVTSGAGLTVLGGIDTYHSYHDYQLAKGLGYANQISPEQVREKLSILRTNSSLTALDIALMPLDFAQVVKLSKARKGGRTSEISKNRTHEEIRKSKTALLFKKKYASANLQLNNQEFIHLSKRPLRKNEQRLYFDVENAVLKKLNDAVLEDKELGDAVTNLIANRVYNAVKHDPLLKDKLKAEYKDYKSLRLMFVLKKGENTQAYVTRLKEIYAQATKELKRELEQTELPKLWQAREGQLGNPEQWFLAGVGEDVLQANMAARSARGMLKQSTTGKLLSFTHAQKLLKQHVRTINSLQQRLAQEKELVVHGILEAPDNGKVLLADPVIEIVRKADRSQGDEAFIAGVRARIKKLYGIELADKQLVDIINYVQEVDALSPPLLLTKREIIPYEQATHGLVSVDFAGIGVRNIKASMRALSSTKGRTLEEQLQAVDKAVEQVTLEMKRDKGFYRDTIARRYQSEQNVYFSGDDGIFIPGKTLTLKDKISLTKELGEKHASRFRLTFVDTSYQSGKEIPAELRSELVVKAEGVEKAIRKKVFGKGSHFIDPAKGQEVMLAVNFHSITGEHGTIDLLASGPLNASDVEKLRYSLKEYLKDNGLRLGKVIVIP